VIDFDEIGRIERRRESWAHRGPRSWGEMSQLIDEYLSDTQTLIDAVKQFCPQGKIPTDR
jgi:hypothetical protein